MKIGVFQVTELGLIAYSIWAASLIWILFKKKHSLFGIIFPLFALAEGLFIDWRWGKLNQWDEAPQILMGGMPSFLIAIGFPFVGFYLHYLLPKSISTYLSANHYFPFSESVEFEGKYFDKYYWVGFIYGFSTLFLHEVSQLFNLSSRNTFDFFDLIAIIAGSIVSIGFYYGMKLSGLKAREEHKTGEGEAGFDNF